MSVGNLDEGYMAGRMRRACAMYHLQISTYTGACYLCMSLLSFIYQPTTMKATPQGLSKYSHLNIDATRRCPLAAATKPSNRLQVRFAAERLRHVSSMPHAVLPNGGPNDGRPEHRLWLAADSSPVITSWRRLSGAPQKAGLVEHHKKHAAQEKEPARNPK